MDVIAMHQAGFTNAVASLGTAFTEGQAVLLKRYVEEVLLLYDSDEAGVKAALRAIPILRRNGIRGKVVSLAPYKDPDEFIGAEGAEEFEKRLSEAENSFFFEIDAIRNEYQMSDPDQKTKFIHEVAKKLLVFVDKVERDNYLEAIAAKHGIHTEDLKNLVIRYGNQNPGGYEESRENRQERREKKKEDGMGHSYKLMLSWLVYQPELYEEISEYIRPEDFLEPEYKEVAEMLYKQLDAKELVPAKIINHFEDAEGQKFAASMFQTDYRVEMNREEKEKALNELIVRIKEYSIENHMRGLTDLTELQKLVQEKKKWQNPGNLHISLKDG